MPLLPDIRLMWKGLPGTNAVNYLLSLPVTKKNCFITVLFMVIKPIFFVTEKAFVPYIVLIVNSCNVYVLYKIIFSN